jgi:hypothetical protein
MTHENFTFWLKGFIEDKQTITQSDVEKIKEKSNQIISEIKWNSPFVAPIHPYTSPLEYKPYGIYCNNGSSIAFNGNGQTDITNAKHPFTLTNN